MLSGLVTGIILVLVFMAIASSKKGASVLGSKTGRVQSFTTPASPEQVLKTLVLFAEKSGYTLSAMDEATGQAVLEEPASFFSWGFFYPVSVSRLPDGTTSVEVGITSKLIQVGPVVTHSHKKCVLGIKSALAVLR